MSKYAAIARDIPDLLKNLEGMNEHGAVLHTRVFAMLARRLADICKEEREAFRLPRSND